MKSNAQKFIDSLAEAEDILEDYPSANSSGLDLDLKPAEPEHFDLALIEQWSELFEAKEPTKPPIRLIQHFSCTGGTLVAKCLAAMPNVALLSEVNPLTQLHIGSKPMFAPTDLTYLARFGKFPLINELSERIFKADINIIYEHLRELGKYLVIREHSHSDFLVGESPNEYSTVRKLLKDDYHVLSVITVRHPVDSYLSLLNNEWMHFNPSTFEEYCKRYLLFIEYNNDSTISKYEGFVCNPENELKLLCEELDLPFHEDFQDTFDLNVMSGDSGRTSNIIGKRARREYDDNFLEEINQSSMYLQLCERLEYDSEISYPDEVNK